MRSLILTFYSLFLFTCNGWVGVRAQRLLLDISPREPVADQVATVTCRVEGSLVAFHYMELKCGKERVLMHKFGTGVTEQRGSWKGRNVQTTFDRDSMLLTVKFAVERRDNGKLFCNMFRHAYPDKDTDLEAEITVHVQQPPSIIGWRLTDAKAEPDTASHETTFLEGSHIAAECEVDLGWPEAKSNLIVPGKPFLAPQPNQYHQLYKNGYFKASHKAYVVVNYKDNGGKFVCVVGNRNGEKRNSIQISVLYSVRDLHFPYNPGAEIQVGSEIACSARGNPAPLVNISVQALDNATRADGPDGGAPLWTRNASVGLTAASKRVPLEAPTGHYGIRCVASNSVRGQRKLLSSRLVRVNVTALQKADMGLILGISIPAAILFLIIVVCCCKKRNKRKRRKRDEANEIDYQMTARRVPRDSHPGRGIPLDYEPPRGVHQQKKREKRHEDGRHANSTGGRPDSLSGAEASKTVWSEVSAFAACEARWQCHGPSSSGLPSNSYQREEDPEYPATPEASLSALPLKPPRSLSSSSRGLNHKPLDSRDAYSPADGASVPFTAGDVAATIDDPHGRGVEAEEEFV